MITIGIPVYNGEKFIYQAVMSVLNQTYTDFELIVTDDGSSDKTLEVLGKFNDPRLRVISDGANRGIAYRLNQQIDLAKGEYFARMDADDLMFPYRLEKEVEFLENNPQVDVVGGEVAVIGDYNELLGKRIIKKGRFSSRNGIFTGTRFIHPTVMGRMAWFKKWRYSENLSGTEDLDLWIRSFKESVFDDIEEPILFYRDPYKFKLKTYLFRQKRYLQCTWNLRKNMDSISYYLICMFRAFLSVTIATVLTIIGKDKTIISKRNCPLSTNEYNKYQEILNSCECG